MLPLTTQHLPSPETLKGFTAIFRDHASWNRRHDGS